jgi:hypothetical protein
MARTNKEIYEAEKKASANISTYEQIALNAMFTLRKELEKEFNAKLIEHGILTEEDV